MSGRGSGCSLGCTTPPIISAGREWVHLVPHSSTADPALMIPTFGHVGSTWPDINTTDKRILKATHRLWSFYIYFKSLQTSIPFHAYLQCLNARLASYLLPVGTFNKEKALVGSFSGHCEPSRRFVDSSNLGSELRDDRLCSKTISISNPSFNISFGPLRSPIQL